MKTILYVDHTSKMGGGEVALFNLVCALDKTRYTPVVALAQEGPLRAKLEGAGIETHIIPLNMAVLDTRKDSLSIGSLLKIRQVGQVLAYAFRLARFIRERQVDLIHTNSLKADLYGGIAGRLADRPVIWHIRDNIDSAYLPPLVARVMRRLAGIIPRVVIANSQSTLGRLKGVGLKATSVVYSGVHLEEADRTAAVASGPPPSARPMHVVHDGFNLDEFPSKTPPGPVGLGTPVVTLVGRIAEWKGQDVFLRAAREVIETFPNVRFWIVGSPMFGEHEYEASLHRLVEELGIKEQVWLTGQRDDVPNLMALSSVIVHASRIGEPFGQVVIEGMAARKPVIATDGGALPEIVIPGVTGLLVPMGDAPAMAAAIREILADPERARAMGRAGRARVEERFTITHSARKVEAVYDAVFSDGAPRSNDTEESELDPQAGMSASLPAG